MGHQDQYGYKWRNISQFAMWLSQSSVYIDKTDQSVYQFQHLAARFDSAMNKWTHIFSIVLTGLLNYILP